MNAYNGETQCITDLRGWAAAIPMVLIVLLTVLEWGGVMYLVHDLADSSTAYHWVAPGESEMPGR